MKALQRGFVFLFLVLISGSLARAQETGPGNALNFTGATGYAQAPNGVWFSNDFTIEGWVFVRSYNNWSRLLDFSDGPNTNNVYLALSQGPSGFPVFGVFTNNNSTPVLEATNQLPLNQWAHLAATLSGTTATIYINGNPAGSTNLNRPPNVIRTNNYIGRSAYSSDSYPNALFDELRIWSGARTQGQIRAGMHRSLVGNEPGLMAYWRMDEGSGTTLTDGSGNGQTATLVGGTSWTNSTAPIVAGAGSALNFNAASNQFISIPHQAAYDAYPITVMTWFMVPTNNTASEGALINEHVPGTSSGYQIYLDGTQLSAYYFRDPNNNVFNSGIMSAGTVNDGFWHHAAMVVDAAGGRLYLDGVQKSTVPWSGTPGPTTTTNGLSLGSYPGTSYFSGQLDEVSIWTNALTATQIQAVMNHPLAGTEPGLVGYWRLDEGSGTNTADATTNGNTGSLINNPTWVSSGARLVVPDPGYGLNLIGNNAFAQVPNGVWFSNAFTIEGWVYARSYNSWSRLLDFGNGNYYQDVYLAFSAETNGYPTLGVFNADGSPPTLSSTNQLPLNQWAHLAATFDGTNSCIYINGILSAFGTNEVSPISVVRTNNYIGQSAFPADSHANAIFDEVRIWNVARTHGQIQDTMNRPLTGTEPNLVGYWRFDDGTGTNAVDGTGNGNDATLINGPTWTITSSPITLAPVIISVSVTNITSTKATLEALVNPSGSQRTLWFSYGTSTNYGFTNVMNAGNGLVSLLFTNNLTGLMPYMVYHFQISVSNSFGLTISGDQSFLAVDPAGVLTTPATAIASTSATLNGELSPDGTTAESWFQYGLTTNYGNVTPSVPVSHTNLVPVALSSVINNLYPGVLYHFSLVGSNSTGIDYGEDLTFTTIALPPAVAPEPASNLGVTNAQLNATVTANGDDTTVWFEYGLNTNYGSTTALTNISGTKLVAIPVTSLISNLAPGTVYHFQTVASNAVGVSYGGDQTFLTPIFGPVPGGFPGLGNSSAAWGDFDNDGRLDILIIGGDAEGISHAGVWRNTGNGFTNINAGLPSVSSGSVAWGDYDNDGLLDILICGETSSGPITQVWRNTGNGFTNINANLPGVLLSSVAWGDYDNDGRLDILLSGQSSSGVPITQVWRNTGHGFTNINAGLPGVSSGSVAWGDYDNDGLLDILISGLTSSGVPITQVWRNTGTGFTNINANLPGVWMSSAAWGDYDNDGRLDIIISGNTTVTAGADPITQIWRNTGTGFTNINANLPAFFQSSVAWGDYDNDGLLDILITGEDGTGSYHADVWRNTGNGFTNINAGMPGVFIGSATWGDYNNDGQLDILLTVDGIAQLWENQTTQTSPSPTATNTPPTAPTGLSASLSGSLLTLSWNPASDLQTPASGLSYNLRVGTSPGGSDIIGSMAGTNGTRRVPLKGTIQSEHYTLQLAPVPAAGTPIYWSVQSIDSSFAGSPFAPETILAVRPKFTSWRLLSDGTFEAQFNVASGTNYTIQASTDLVHWSDLLDFTFENSGPVLFTDPSSTNFPHRFYRFGQH